MSFVDESDFVLGVAEREEHPDDRHDVYDAKGNLIGHVDVPGEIHRDEFEHLKHEFMHLRNVVSRLQTQVKILETKRR